MKFLLSILILMVSWSCSQQPKNSVGLLNYVKSPARADLFCREEIERATNDIQNGEIVFTQTAGFLFGFIRYEEELSLLCEQHGLQFNYDMLSCIVQDGQTQGCYGATMENEIIRRFGVNFKKRLHERADSLFLSNVLANNRSVDSWDCDEQPRQLAEFKATLNVNELDIRKAGGKHEGWPFIDLQFVIELDSTISDFRNNKFVPMDSANSIYEHELFTLASNYLQQKYPIWIPGTIKSQPVRTNHNVRIFFEKE